MSWGAGSAVGCKKRSGAASSMARQVQPGRRPQAAGRQGAAGTRRRRASGSRGGGPAAPGCWEGQMGGVAAHHVPACAVARVLECDVDKGYVDTCARATRCRAGLYCRGLLHSRGDPGPRPAPPARRSWWRAGLRSARRQAPAPACAAGGSSCWAGRIVAGRAGLPRRPLQHCSTFPPATLEKRLRTFWEDEFVDHVPGVEVDHLRRQRAAAAAAPRQQGAARRAALGARGLPRLLTSGPSRARSAGTEPRAAHLVRAGWVGRDRHVAGEVVRRVGPVASLEPHVPVEHNLAHRRVHHRRRKLGPGRHMLHPRFRPRLLLLLLSWLGHGLHC